MVAGHLQEKKGFYYMVINLVDEAGKRKPKWISTGLPVKGNKRKAMEMLDAERQKYASNVTTSSLDGDMLFADYMLYWLGIKKANIELSTYGGYQGIVENRIAPYFRERNIRLRDLRAIDIQDFYTYCTNTLGVSNNRVIHYHANISSALNYAVRKDLIMANPLGKVDRPAQQEHLAAFYTLGEVELLFDVVRGDGVEFPVLMAAFYGLRRSEIMGLRWQSIDFESNTITIEHTVVQTRVDKKTVVVAKDRAKNKKSCRSLPLVPQYRELLLQMKEHQEKCRRLCGNCYFESDYIYVNDMGQPFQPDYVTRHFALLLKKNKLRKITFHELRHSCASMLLKNGVSMKEIQAWLGHSTYSTTANIYAHLEKNSKLGTSSAMSGVLDIGKSLAAAQSREAGKNSGKNSPEK